MLKKDSVRIVTLLASSIAGIVGSGWLLGPLACVKITGPAAVISWLVAGILMLVVASTFVILARTLRVAGGTVRFLQMSHGHFAGFSFSWIAWLAWVAVPPIETMALLQYASNYIPSLMTSGANPVLTSTGLFSAVIITGIICVINCFGIRPYEMINHIVLAFKLLIPTVTVFILVSHHFSAHNFVAHGGFMPYGIHSIFAAMPLAGVIYSYIGFNPAIQLAAETKDTKRAIPIAIFGSLIICILLFTAVQIAFIGAIPGSILADGWQHLSFAGDRGTFAGLLAAFGFAWFVKALYVDALVSPFGTAMVQSMAVSRISYAMSENRYLPAWMRKVNRFHAPAIALIINTVIGCSFFLPFPSWQHMVGFLVSCLVIGYVAGPMSLIAFYKTQPEKFRQYPAWFMHGICLLAFYICNLMVFWTGWSTMSTVSIVFAAGYVILFLKTYLSRKANRQPLNIMRGSWVIAYIIGLALISYFSSFGGTDAIRFGYDFIVVAGFTTVIYVLGYFSAVRS